MSVVEPTNIGLSERAHTKLKRLQEDGHFEQMVDAYRCAIALALAHGVVPSELPTPRTNIFGVATVDPDRELQTAISLLMVPIDGPIYRWAERLAEWGIDELFRLAEGGEIDFSALLQEVQAKSPKS